MANIGPHWLESWALPLASGAHRIPGERTFQTEDGEKLTLWACFWLLATGYLVLALGVGSGLLVCGSLACDFWSQVHLDTLGLGPCFPHGWEHL